MNGKITFQSIEDMAEFLKYFTGSTATFNVHQEGFTWILEFTGGC